VLQERSVGRCAQVYMKRNLTGMDIDVLEAFFAELGESRFRANQLAEWIYGKKVLSFDCMTNLSKELRAKLDLCAYIGDLRPLEKRVSKIDGTCKYLFELDDKDTIESVLLRYGHGYSACISTQVGCKMGCAFCETARCGYRRDLKVGEIIGQVLGISRDLDDSERIRSIVMMGMGEPFDNYTEVIKAVRLMNLPTGLNIGYRRITISTSGIVPGILRLANEKIPVTLSVSLHAPDDETRTELMPINKKYNISRLLNACDRYVEATGRRVTFEYILIQHVNDSLDKATGLVRLLGEMLCHVNLIPMNPISDTAYYRPTQKTVEAFAKVLMDAGIPVTIRRELGADIDAACGQLRRRYL
jgi:23S rRNA (adenine2503-C2)-methyltransferase